MHKEIEILSQGHMVPLGPDMMVRRVIPNHYIQTVGPFVFLDHMGPTVQNPDVKAQTRGTGAHPHRGIITFTYLFSGEVEHYDSRGNHSIVKAGGAQWMKAGNGIIHDEGPTREFQQQGGTLHGIQLWINLPGVIKNEEPEYAALQSADVPEIELGNNAGKLRVLLGEYSEKKSPLKNFSSLVNLHLQLNASSNFELKLIPDFEYGIYLPLGEITIGNKQIRAGEFATLSAAGDVLALKNENQHALDIMIYGGLPLGEPMYAEGPFVMGNKLEIAHAYRDFYAGKYGEITY